MSKQTKILITNDDGINAQGIRALWKAIEPLGKITIVAPAKEQSGKGLSLTTPTPLEIRKNSWDNNTPCWSVSGTPAECVKIALSVILKNPPDLIVSGINKGSNAGRNILYSGTIGATIEGAFRGIPGVALSCECYANPDYKFAQKYIPSFIRYMLKHPLPYGSIWNVNFPKENYSDTKGFKIARQGQSYWVEDPHTHEDHSEKSPLYNLGMKYLDSDEHDHCDTSLLKQGFITAVPIHIGELTDRSEFLKRQNHTLQL